ncbi:MAG: YmdB family metallophosphoesterase [Cyanobacteria bacterium SIG30]|nr:YmdB family metallophosphoesterase [Cyanobacteria bacterium SIG30]
MSNDYKILFLGDIVGRPGRKIAQKFISEQKVNYDLVIVNVENASHGFGLTKRNHDELFECGISCMTSGNHIWDKKDVYEYINTSEALIRPLNYPKIVTDGVGYRIYDNNIVVVNLLGRTFMQPVDSPFEVFDNLVEKLGKDKFYIVDFHAEATAEKICFGTYLSQNVSGALIGTHTHVQTADEKILNNRFAHITDAGFTGSYDGVIGMQFENSYKFMTTLIQERFEVPEHVSKYQINGCEIILDLNNNVAKSIKRINEVCEVAENEN